MSDTTKKPRLKKTTWIPVVAGFLTNDKKVLIGQRPENNTLPGQWEFPGGKIELGETPEEALYRELEEELGIQANIGDLKMVCTHSYSDIGIVIIFFEVYFWKGEPKAKHHMMLEWVYPEELLSRNIPEANRKMLPQIFNILGAKWPKSY